MIKIIQCEYLSFENIIECRRNNDDRQIGTSLTFFIFHLKGVYPSRKVYKSGVRRRPKTLCRTGEYGRVPVDFLCGKRDFRLDDARISPTKISRLARNGLPPSARSANFTHTYARGERDERRSAADTTYFHCRAVINGVTQRAATTSDIAPRRL